MICKEKGKGKGTHGASCGTLFLFCAKLMTVNCRGRIRGVGTREIVDNLGGDLLGDHILSEPKQVCSALSVSKTSGLPRDFRAGRSVELRCADYTLQDSR